MESAVLVVWGIIPVDLISQEQKQIYKRKMKYRKQNTKERLESNWFRGRKNGAPGS